MVYVIGKDGKPLMPTNKHAYVRMLLKAGKAKVICTLPFTIQLLYDTAGSTQPVTLGIDPGRTNIGVATRAEGGKCLFAAELVTRNKDVPKLMCNRREFRRQHRLHRRQKAQRREKSCSGTERIIRRILPGCGEPITCKYFKNKQARFHNRKRQPGWLTPTVTHLVRTHVNFVKLICKFLSVTSVVLEANKFAFMKLADPRTHGRQYQHGRCLGLVMSGRHWRNSRKDAACYAGSMGLTRSTISFPGARAAVIPWQTLRDYAIPAITKSTKTRRRLGGFLQRKQASTSATTLCLP